MRNTMLRRLSALTAMLALISGMALLGASPEMPLSAPEASARPPSGAGSNTPGTHSEVRPTTVAVGGTLHFTVSGFPAGETVSIKIDDGESHGNTAIHGSGVVHQQKIGADGVADGSFELPGDVGEGSHWLRFLATETFGDDGESRGYTNRSPDFTVVAAGAGDEEGGDTGGGNSGGDGNNAGNAGGNAAGGAAAGGARSGGGGGGGAEDTGNRNTVVRPGASANSTGGRSGNAQAAGGSQRSGAKGAGQAGAAKGGEKARGGKGAAGPLGFGDGAQVVGYTEDGQVLLANQQGWSAPVFGLIVAGAIIVVGLGLIASLVFLRFNPTTKAASAAAPAPMPMPMPMGGYPAPTAPPEANASDYWYGHESVGTETESMRLRQDDPA